MRILKLTAENIKRLTAVEIKPDPQGNLVIIAGRNGQGKTSVLDAILYGLGGKSAIPDMPIRKGQKKAEVQISLDGEQGTYLVTRRFTAKGSYLEVKDPRTASTFDSPQALLDSFLGDFTMDPLRFSRMSGAAQREVLLRIAPIDFDLAASQDRERSLYEARTQANRDLRRMEAQLADRGEPPEGTPDEPVSIDDALAYLDQCTEQQAANNRARTDLQRLHQIAEDLANRLRAQQAEKEAVERRVRTERDMIEARLIALQHDADVTAESIWTAEAAVETLADPDVADARARVSMVEEINAQVRAKLATRKLRADADAMTEQVGELTADIEGEQTMRAGALAEVKMPIGGLSFTEDGVTYGGVPIDQISSSEKLRVGMSIAMALNPNLRIIRIDDGSLLDTDNLGVIEELARERDFQVWIERVSEDGGVGFVIEDGALVARPGEPTVARDADIEELAAGLGGGS